MATDEETTETRTKSEEKTEQPAMKIAKQEAAGKILMNSYADDDDDDDAVAGGLRTASMPVNATTTNGGTENRLGDNQYFFEDQVFFVNKAGRVEFGLVIETCDCYSGDEDDEDDEEEKLNRGEVRVAWYPHGREIRYSEDSIGLADRTLMPGDVVRRMASGCNAQRGYVRDIKITADVKVLGTPYVIKNVAAERLRPLSVWQRDCTVCVDSWVGSAKNVDEVAVLSGTNGVRFEVNSSDFYHFKEATTSRRPSVFSPLIFFPGNVVIGRLPSLDKAKVLTPDIPLPLSRKGSMLKGKFVVESVRTEGVFVQWQCKALSKCSSKGMSELQPPKPFIKAEELSQVKRLNVFESCVLQIADRSFLTFEPKDLLITKNKWEKELAARFKETFAKQQKSEKKKPKVNSKSTKSAANASKSKEQKLPEAKSITSQNSGNSEKSSAAKKAASEKEASSTTDGEWLDTTTTNSSDSSEQSEDESEIAQEIEVDEEIIECSDIDSVVATNADEEAVGNFHGGAGASSKRSSPAKCISKKATALRNKHYGHSKSQGSIPKWSPKNSNLNPFVALCSVKEYKEIVTETLLVYSTVSVVWQDGTVEHDIPSTELYPIHHLDNHEFFPGDFTMLSREDPDITFRDYGVIQTVDHHGRTARVKWFKTYSGEEESKPTYKGETEVSVYDLKDHPDYTFRPGGMVIRVSNFIGEDEVCTAGQVLDNCTDGRVKVAWVDGHVSDCWPQDLFDVGHHEQNDYTGDSDSWETQSEHSIPGCDEEDDEEEDTGNSPSAENDIIVNVERTRAAIARLEDIFRANPHLQSRSVMRKLLSIYKTGRYIDRLLQTSFFHEDLFLGLIERVNQEDSNREAKRADDSNDSQLSQDVELNVTGSEDSEILTKREKKSDLIQSSNNGNTKNCLNFGKVTSRTEEDENVSPLVAVSTSNDSSKVVFKIGYHIPNCSNSVNDNVKSNENSVDNDGNNQTSSARQDCPCCNLMLKISETSNYQAPDSKSPAGLIILRVNELEKLFGECQNPEKASQNSCCLSSNNQFDNFSAEKNHLLSSALLSIEMAYQVTNSIKANVDTLLSQDDSGNFSHSNGDIGMAEESSGNLVEENTSLSSIAVMPNKNAQDADSLCELESPEQVPIRLFCAPFCLLLKKQLQKCKEEIELQCNRFSSYKSQAIPVAMEDNKAEESGIVLTKKDANASCESAAEITIDMDKISSPAAEKEAVKNQLESSPVIETTAKPWIVPEECFKILPNAPKEHKFYTSACEPSQPQHYFRAIQKEHRLLKTSLPKGIWLRFFEDRIDLLSVMMEGPKKTPYENGLYFFDMQLGRDYPKRPPVCHYISYCVDRLNPNLYEEGKVCVSLLGTWSGRDVEVWGSNSTLLQVLVSIQGLILVPEPYFNEAGYEKQKGSLQGLENSRMYNEMVVIKVTQATMKMLHNPPSIFAKEIIEYYKQNGLAMYERIRGWMELSRDKLVKEIDGKKEDSQVSSSTASTNGDDDLDFIKPDFPLLPASRGFRLTLEALLKNFKTQMEKLSNDNADEQMKTTENVATNEIKNENENSQRALNLS